jgi:HrpA-like RNA helicase
LRCAEIIYKIFVVFDASSQSGEQATIFKPVPRNTRKVILSTNIAETSITIPDVIFVVDCGKVKEKQYELFTGACTLRPVWISKAAAVQRSGRAGRNRPGVCYRLYSSIRFEQMAEFQTPEILRTPLQELCLQAKAMMIDCASVADFLGKAPDPPPATLIREAITCLKVSSLKS